MKICLPYTAPYTSCLRLIGLLSVFCISGHKESLLVPELAMKMVGNVLIRDHDEIRLLRPIYGMLLFLLGRVLGTIFGQGQEMALEYCTQHMSRHFATESFRHLQPLSLSYHTKKRTGTMTSIIGRGIQSNGVLLRLTVFSLGRTVPEAIVVLAIFFKLGSPLIAFTTSLSIVLYMLYTAYITKWRIKFGCELREAENNALSPATKNIMKLLHCKILRDGDGRGFLDVIPSVLLLRSLFLNKKELSRGLISARTS